MTREGLFDDRPCSDIYPFVCKILGNDTKYNEECDNFDIGGLLLLFCFLYQSVSLDSSFILL